MVRDKSEVRDAFRAARRALTPEVRKRANKSVLHLLQASTVVAKAKTVLIYAATEVEVQLDDLIGPLTRAGKRVAVPRMTKTPGVMTLWAIKHSDALVKLSGSNVRTPDITRAVPIEPKDVDVVLVPGVAFTATLGRLGQGAGYYDRLLPRLRPEAKKIGVAFDIQIAEDLPLDLHDVSMDAVVTEARVYGDKALLTPLEQTPSLQHQSPFLGTEVPTAQLAEPGIDASAAH
jgi:5-formyltetrahydrofolate cyclo-ligase